MKRILCSALMSLTFLNACATTANTATAVPVSPTVPQAALSSAAKNGELLFTSAGCAGCHSTGTEQRVGPGLAGFMAGRGTNGNKLPNGQEITDDHVKQWIRDGNAINGGLMPANPALSDQNFADLIAYLRTLE